MTGGRPTAVLRRALAEQFIGCFRVVQDYDRLTQHGERHDRPIYFGRAEWN